MAPAVAEQPTIDLAFVPIKDLKESPLNPRRHFDQASLEELAASMGNGRGVLEPLLARRPGEIIAGARRLRAARIAKLEVVPVIWKDGLSDADVLEAMVIENDQRKDMTPLERAEGYRKLLKLGTLDVPKLAARIGRSKSWVYDVMKLEQLVPAAKQLLEEERITMAHGVLLSRLTSDQQTRAIAPHEEALFEYDDSMFGAESAEDRAAAKDDPYVGLKVVPVKAFERWIRENVRLDVTEPLVRELFPEVAAHVERAEKVVSITLSHYVEPETSETGDRIYKADEWKKADGSKGARTCKASVLGVVVIGRERGSAFQVCVDRDCKSHWPAAKTTAAPAPTRADKQYEAQQKSWRDRERREREARERFKSVLPAVLKACHARVRELKPAALLTVASNGVDQHALRKAKTALGGAKTADQALQLLALTALESAAATYDGARIFPPLAKAIGLDLKPFFKTVKSSGKTKAKAKASKNR